MKLIYNILIYFDNKFVQFKLCYLVAQKGCMLRGEWTFAFTNGGGSKVLFIEDGGSTVSLLKSSHST